MKNRICIVIVLAFALLKVSAQNYPFRDTSLSLNERINDLISRLTLQEKVLLMQHNAKGVERLGIPEYNWWNEGLHGVARTDVHTTVFPQAIAMAATFDAPLMKDIGDCISTEGRAIFNKDYKSNSLGGQYRGLTYWSPNINIFRDPRWGRGQETYGEDPYLTGHMAVSFIQGIQGDDPYYYKATACVKHLAIHSGPETQRHIFDARPSLYDLWDTYLPAFRTSIREGHVAGVMCAYNRVEGIPCCGNNALLVDILRNQLGFDGYLVSDCWAVSDFFNFHKTHANEMTAASDAILAGTDLECGATYQSLAKAVERGLLSEKNINVSLARDFNILFRLGLFDPQEIVPYSSIGDDVLECEKHKELANKAARESIVLLKNSKNFLPLDLKKIKRIALVGPNADNGETQLGNYNGFPSEIITPLKSLKKRVAGTGIEMDYIKGCGLTDKIDSLPDFKAVASRAKKADIILFVGGINPKLEGENGDTGKEIEGFAGGDRTSLELPSVQTELLTELGKTGRPVVMVNMSGSAVTQTWAQENAVAIIQAWYCGQSADCITDVLFGDYNPCGKLPVTIYKTVEDLPAFTDYSMQNRTYRYFKGDVQYPFGYGLSYTTFDITSDTVQLETITGSKVKINAKITNTGSRDGEEVVQVYISHKEPSDNNIKPICSLKGFKRIFLKSNETKEIEFTLNPEDLALVDSKGNLKEQQGRLSVYIGNGQPGKSQGVYREINIKGDTYSIN